MNAKNLNLYSASVNFYFSYFVLPNFASIFDYFANLNTPSNTSDLSR